MELRKTTIKPEKSKPQKSKFSTVSNIHKDHRSRLKNQFLQNGLTALTDIQKLELLLFYAIPQKDTNPIAHNLIDTFGSLKSVLKADTKSLMKVNGVKENTATLISLVNNILNYCTMPESDETISSTEEAKAYASRCFLNVDVEQFYVFCLSKSNRVLKRVLVSSGSSDEVSVQIRTITQIALDSKCNRIIVAHNHPNSEANMSDEDCAFTYSLLCSCVLNSIELLDHIVVGINGATSFGGRGLMDKLKKRAISTIQLPQDKQSLLSAVSENYSVIQEN